MQQEREATINHNEQKKKAPIKNNCRNLNSTTILTLSACNKFLTLEI